MQTEVIQTGKIMGKRGLSSAVLKNIAVVTMLIDHIGAVIVIRLLIQKGLYGAMVDQEAYIAWVGQNRGMLLFALISEIPFDLAFSGRLWNMQYQNVFFTLFIGLMVIAGLRLVDQRLAGPETWRKLAGVGLYAVIIVAGSALALALKTDYSFKGILAITVLYLFRSHRKAQIWAGVIIFLLMDGMEMIAALSFLLIWFYNGARGRQNKYFFYFFYPAHLLVLWLICVVMGIAGIPAI